MTIREDEQQAIDEDVASRIRYSRKFGVRLVSTERKRVGPDETRNLAEVEGNLFWRSDYHDPANGDTSDWYGIELSKEQYLLLLAKVDPNGEETDSRIDRRGNRTSPAG